MPALANPRHEAFCQAYAKGEHAGNATQAYGAAGFKPDRKKASRLRQRADIGGRIAELVAEIREVEAETTKQAIEKVGIDKEWVLSRLVSNAERAMQAEPVIAPDGEPTGEYKYDGAVANKALELLGKHVGLFIVPVADPQSLNVRVGVELVDRPPRETYDEWNARRQRELAGKERLNKPKEGKSK